jgi:catechol 2,3-dioxygenase-like lactoylglutathione lyase family enzyme
MEDRPVLDQVNLVVRDMDAMVAFYRQLGVEVEQPPAAWEKHHRSARMPEGIDLDLDSSVFASQWNRGWPPGGSGPVLGFRVSQRETVDALYARLTGAGYEGQQAPYDAFWGARYALVADPDGNTVGIMSESDPARRSQPTPPSGQ